VNHPPFQGLIAATPTAFDACGAVNLNLIEEQAHHLLTQGVQAAFVCGSTGECHSLTVDERQSIAQRWRDVVQGTELKLIVHVGGNCLSDAQQLARHAQQIQADAIAALSPSYFKPGNVAALVASMAKIAGQANDTAFFFYDIPSMTGVHLSMPQFLEQAAEAIPNLAGLKFTNADMSSLQHCLQAQAGAWNILWGIDEVLLAAWTLGVRGAVGSSYNFCAPLHRQAIAAWENADWPTAQHWQYRAVQWIEILARYGYLAAAKHCLECLGVPVGPVRLPLENLTVEAKQQLRRDLVAAGFLTS
jgi:N-acetylneuraminate lyase